MRRVLLPLVAVLCMLGVAPPAQALSAPYELDYPANCVSSCTYRTNITSAVKRADGTVRLTMRFLCPTRPRAGASWAPEPEYELWVDQKGVERSSTTRFTGQIVCDGVRGRSYHVVLPAADGIKLGRIDVRSWIEWGWAAPPAYGRGVQRMLDPVRVVRG